MFLCTFSSLPFLPPPLYITDSVGICIIIALKAKGYSEYLDEPSSSLCFFVCSLFIFAHFGFA